jgi:hypothetical protein
MEAALCLALARIGILLLPFPRIARHLGTLHAPSAGAADSLAGKAMAEDISWAIDRAARLSPVPLVCLPRALAGWKMLQRRGISARLHFGASRKPGGKTLLTHAWLDACGVEVSGYPQAHNCVEMGYYTC